MFFMSKNRSSMGSREGSVTKAWLRTGRFKCMKVEEIDFRRDTNGVGTRKRTTQYIDK